MPPTDPPKVLPGAYLPGQNPENPYSDIEPKPHPKSYGGSYEKGQWSPYGLGPGEAGLGKLGRPDTYQAPGMPPVDMSHRQWGETLKQRVAEDMAQTERTSTNQRPDYWEDPEQVLDLYQKNAEIYRKSDPHLAHYYQGLAHGIEQAGRAQTKRLERYYQQRPDIHPNVAPPTKPAPGGNGMIGQ